MYFPLQSTQVLSAYLKRAGHTTDVAIGSPSEIVKYCKKEKSERTTSDTKKLTSEERIEEIAKMLSGKKVTKTSINNAKELLSQ